MRHPSRLTFGAVLLGALALASCSSDSLSRKEKEAMFQTHRDFAFAYWAMGPEAYDRCQSQIYKALEYDADDVELRVLLGQVLLRKGGLQDVASAELVYRSLLADDDPRAELGLATCLERRGLFYDEAARGIALGERFTDAPDPAKRAAELARTARELWTESERFYRRTYALAPDDRAVLNGLQRITALQGRPRESLEFSQHLVEVCERDLATFRDLLQRPDLSARDEDSHRLSISELETLLKRTHFHAAGILAQLGEPREALAQLGEVVALDPELPEVHSRRAQLYKELGDYAAALAEIEEFLRLSDLPFEHADIDAAYALKTECEEALRS